MSKVGNRRAVLLEPISSINDLAAIERLGKVTTMFSSPPYVGEAGPSVFNTEAFKAHIQKWLCDNDYDPKEDSFVVTGRATKVAIALAIIVQYYPGEYVNVLIYDGHAQGYVERKI